MSGCGILPSPEDTIKSPGETVQPGHGNEVVKIEKQIIESLPSKVKLLRPKQPEGAETIQFKDIDGNGKEEALVVYVVPDNIREPHAAVFKEQQGKWSKIWDVKGSGYDLDYSGFSDITGNGNPEILLGWTMGASVGNGLDIYEWDKNQPKLLTSTGYHKINVGNMLSTLGEDQKIELALWDKDTAVAYSVDVYRWDENELVPAPDVYPAYFPKVVQYYKGLVVDNPNAAILWYYLADADLKAGSPDEAIQHAQQGKSLAQDFPPKEKFDMIIQKAQEQINSKWEQVSRGQRVEADITNLKMESNILKSMTIKVTKDVPLETNPVDQNYKGKVFELKFNDEELTNFFKGKLKIGEHILITFAQFAAPSMGEAVLGSTLDFIIVMENGKQYNSKGEKVTK